MTGLKDMLRAVTAALPPAITRGFAGGFARFGVVGVTVTALHVIIAATLIESGRAGPAVANGAAFIVAASASFALNTKYTFRSDVNIVRLSRFFVVAILCGLLSMALAGGCELLGLPYQVGILVVVACVPPLSYLSHRLWTYA